MIPYLLSLVAWLIYKLLRYENVSLFYYFISNNIGNWLPNTWFVWVLLVAYVCYFTEITYIAILLIFVFDIVTAYFIQALSCFIIKKI